MIRRMVVFMAGFMLVPALSTSIAASAQPKNVHAFSGARRPVTDRDSIAREMQQTLDREFACWYPASIDRASGGFLSDFDFAWDAHKGRQDKMIVTQARHVWAASNAALFYDDRASLLRGVAHHGTEFLQHVMWDAQDGGFYELVNRAGEPVAQHGELIKTAYGNIFALYALAACALVYRDTSALRSAKDAFFWLEQHSYDPRYGGYFQFLSRTGAPYREGYDGTPPKDYNSLIHLLEGYTQLYRVWKDPLVKERLASLLAIVRDTVASKKGYLKLYFNADWTPGGDQHRSEFNHISFGHDVETAYLMLEASDALELRNDTTTLGIAKRMVDHALEHGWDRERGGLFDEGKYDTHGGASAEMTIIKRSKEWWAQAEAFNAFLVMSELFPDDPHRYYEKFCAQWNYCMNYLIDHEHGGWYWGGIDIVPENIHSPKGSIWKCNYHTSRSLINCINRLKTRRAGNTTMPQIPREKQKR